MTKDAGENRRRRKGRYGPTNAQWRGGRSVTADGYVLVRVPLDHHLADVRGYAYEHRIVAEQMLGRRLLPGERVRFKSGNKSDTAPHNLVIVPKRDPAEMRAEKIARATLRKRGVLPVPESGRQELFDWYDGKCAYCEAPATALDHVTPIISGGQTEPGNMLPACALCNGSKHARCVAEWIVLTGRAPPVRTIEWLAEHGHLDVVDDWEFDEQVGRYMPKPQPSEAA